MKVILNKPGVIACGQHRKGVAVEVSQKEGDRLIKNKGFILAPDSSELMEIPTVEEINNGAS